MAKKSIQLRENYYLEDYYQAVLEEKQDLVYLYHSDVFFVRAALEQRLGVKPTLKDTETAMKLMGWKPFSKALPAHNGK
jgi:nitrogenase molybdenum-iron protein alpha/beta subunit